jgi:ubiquinone/menaquinone biosynthesis C-methylase UbiE
MNEKKVISRALEELGAKPSKSEEHGLALLGDDDVFVFCPGVSSGGFAEIRMAMKNSERSVVATTIDEEGIGQVKKNISTLGLEDKIDIKLEDLRKRLPYDDNSFDFIYARLVLHYLSMQDLEDVLSEFHRVAREGGRLFIVVRSTENVNYEDELVGYEDDTRLTTEVYRNDQGEVIGRGKRYLHTPESITSHLKKAAFEVVGLDEYDEQLYGDFMRREKSSIVDHLIEVMAVNNGSD